MLLILRKALRTMSFGFIIKLLFTLVSSKLNPKSILKHPKPILRFGFMCFSLTFIYKSLRLIMDRLKIEWSRDLQIFIAAGISSLSLYLASSKDMNLLKLLLFPRAIESIYCLLKERGYIKPIKHGEILFFIISQVTVVFFYIHENYALEPSMRRSIDRYMNLTPAEKYLRLSFTGTMQNRILDKYPNSHRFDVKDILRVPKINQ